MNHTEMLSKVEKPIVFYHGLGCRDGWCAAFLAALRWPDATLVPVNYDDAPWWKDPEAKEPHDLLGRDVLVVDFSFKRGDLLELRDLARSLLVLDHHKTAAAELAGLDFCVFDMERSGAGLALDCFFLGARQNLENDLDWPWEFSRDLVDLVLRCEAWDLWKHARFPDVKEVCAFVDTLPRTVVHWADLPDVADMRTRGAAVLAYQRQQVLRVVLHAKEVSWDDLGTVAVVNSCVLQSEVGEALYELKPERASAVWYLHASGEIVVSLRSKSGVGPDVGAAAKRRGGGGHRHSAGFRVKPGENRDSFGLGFGNLLGKEEVRALGGRPFAQGFPSPKMSG